MEFTRLGRTGLQVSRICLGCMTYGEPSMGAHPWTLPEADSQPLIRQAVEAGINFFDTANIYSNGSSEEIVGRALREYAVRDEIVVATKVRFGWRKGSSNSAPAGHLAARWSLRVPKNTSSTGSPAARAWIR